MDFNLYMQAACCKRFNCQHMLAVAMTFDARRPYTISLSMFNHIFRTKNPLTDTDSLTPRVRPSSSDDTLAASRAKKLQHARSLFTTQMNYTQGYHASRDMCLRVQHDPEETKLWLKHIEDFCINLVSHMGCQWIVNIMPMVSHTVCQ